MRNARDSAVVVTHEAEATDDDLFEDRKRVVDGDHGEREVWVGEDDRGESVRVEKHFRPWSRAGESEKVERGGV